MLSDDAVDDGSCMARNSLFTLVLTTSKLYCSGNTLAGRVIHYLAVRIRNEEPNRLVRQDGISTTCRQSFVRVAAMRETSGPGTQRQIKELVGS